MTSLVHRLSVLLVASALAACGTSNSGGSGPDGGSAGINAGASGGGEGGSGGAGSGGNAGSSGSGGSAGSSGSSGSGGNAGSGGQSTMDAAVDSSLPNDSGSDAATGGDVAEADVFYFGHSLVGHDMPQMIGAFARARSKDYAVHGQIGFGTPLQSHWRWEGDFNSGFVPVGFAAELPGSLLFDVDGHTALESGQYDVVVLTESNGFVSGAPGAWNEFCTEGQEFGGCAIEMTVNLVRKARMNNPAVRTLLYTNWKDFGELGGIDNWLADIEANVGWWENLADKADAMLTASGASGSAIRVVPAAPIVARIVTEARSGELAEYGINDHGPLFIDNVHLSRTGFYVIALIHYAAIFRDSPVGLPNTVDVVSGDKASLEMNGFTLDAGLATHLQNVVWEELQAYPRSGVND